MNDDVQYRYDDSMLMYVDVRSSLRLRCVAQMRDVSTKGFKCIGAYLYSSLETYMIMIYG